MGRPVPMRRRRTATTGTATIGARNIKVWTHNLVQ